MIATYRLQLAPGFGFARARELLPYLRRLGVSHLYLSPVAEAAPGSLHGYDVTDHNRVRAELGGREGLEALREAARAEGLGLILDIVPNHAGLGPANAAWQDLLAYGPHSAWAAWFDVDWRPLKSELEGKVLLPFLGRPYGEALEAGDVRVVWEDGALFARYYDERFALAPRTWPAALRANAAPGVGELRDALAALRPEERGRAEALRSRLAGLVEEAGLEPARLVAELGPDELHELLERQSWRLAWWRTAAHEINYRRFFDIDRLVALRQEEPEVFRGSHRLLGELLGEEGIDGVRVDHVDGLFDPGGYLERLRALGAEHVWVEKILAPGEILPDAWPTEGTTGYEFMNDALRLLVAPEGEEPLRQVHRHATGSSAPYEDVLHDAKRFVMEASLASELTRLAFELERLSEADPRTRDFTLVRLREALAEVVAAFPRYRTYLPEGREEAGRVIGTAVATAKRRARAIDPVVFDFVADCLLAPPRPGLEERLRRFVGRFQAYTAPVAAKGTEDTAFYRYAPLAALNEVGGEPDVFSIEPQAFHARARFRAHRYPRALLATATHDHKRGEDTRARLAVLAEIPDAWREAVARLDERARALQADLPLGSPRVHPADAYLFYQHLAALRGSDEPDVLAERLAAYMRKAVREAKLRSDWSNPDEAYEAALDGLVRALTTAPETGEALEPVASALARHGFANALSQLVLKLVTPGVPDIYRGAELLDLSLVDPDNRRPVDWDERRDLLDALEPLLAEPDPEEVRRMAAGCEPRAKLYVLARLLRLRREAPALFAGSYEALEPEGERARHLVALAREGGGRQLVAFVARFPATLEAAGGWGRTRVPLPERFRGGGWREALSGWRPGAGDALEPGGAPLPVAVLVRDAPAPLESAPEGARTRTAPGGADA